MAKSRLNSKMIIRASGKTLISRILFNVWHVSIVLFRRLCTWEESATQRQFLNYLQNISVTIWRILSIHSLLS